MKTRKWTRTLTSVAVASGLVSCTAVANADLTTTLTGTEASDPGLGSNDTVPTDHGSTAETTLTWDSEWDVYSGWPNDPGNGVYQVDQLTHTINFTPISSEFNVSIDDFDLNVWAGGGDTDVDWSVLDGPGGSVLANGSVTVADGSIQNIAIGYTGSFGQALTLQLDQLNGTGGTGSYLAMDNLTFSSTAVPEPAGAALLVAGIGGLVLRRRRS